MKTTRLKRTLRTRTAAQEKLLRWSGPVDEVRLNRTLLRLMRAVRGRQHLSLHALEARSGIKRPQLRKLEQELMQLTLFTLVRWCNGLRLDIVGLLQLALLVLRQRPLRQQ